MSEKGKITIGVGVDSGPAIDGLEDLQTSLNELAGETEAFGDIVSEEFENLDDASKKSAEQLKKDQKKTEEALSKTGKQAKKTGKDIKNSANESIEGLDELRDSAGDSASAMSGIAGAVSVVNPELGSMISNASALSGGIEGAAKGAGIFRSSISALTSPVGLVAVGVLAAGAALFAWSKRSRGATIDTEELAGAIEALDAAQKRFMSTKIELSVARGETTRLRAELENLSSTIEDEFAASMQEVNDPFKQFETNVETATNKTNAFLKKMEEAGVSKTPWGGWEGDRKLVDAMTKELDKLVVAQNEAEAALQDALDGQSEAAVARREMIQGIKDEEAARREILEIRIQQETESKRQSKLLRAQADNDTKAIRQVSMEMAIQGDVSMQAAMQFLNYGASMAKAALAATGLLGPALTASMAAIDAQLQATKEQILIDTRYNSILQDNLRGMQSYQAAQEEAAVSSEELAQKQSVAADMLAQARGNLAMIDREYAKQIVEINALRAAGAISEEETAELINAALNERNAAEQAFHDEKKIRADEEAAMIADSIALTKSETQIIQDEYEAQFEAARSNWEKQLITFEEFKAKIEELEDQKNARIFEAQRQAAEQQVATVAMVGQTIASTVNSFADMMLQDLKNEEEEALAAAGDNLEEQEKIKAEFEKKRQKEMARVFKIQKGVEIANVGINAASASIAALGPPPTGLGPVLGPALIPFIVGAAAAQIAVIASKKPSFHQGGIVGGGPGDQPIMAQAGEVVLSRSAVASMGGAQAANQLNEGGAPGRPVVVQMTYKNRVFDQIVVDNLAKGGPLKNALNKATNRGKRGRVGGRL